MAFEELNRHDAQGSCAEDEILAAVTEARPIAAKTLMAKAVQSSEFRGNVV